MIQKKIEWNRYYIDYIRMSQFIKIQNLVLNVQCIQRIVIKPNVYIIQFSHSPFAVKGNMWNILGSGIGYIETSVDNPDMEICKKKHPNSYERISKWISMIE